MLIQYPIDTFINSKLFSNIIVVIDKTYRHLIKGNVLFVDAGKNRTESCYNALKYINKHYLFCGNVIITDACRPCITTETLSKCVSILDYCDAFITVCKSINTSCIVKDYSISEILDRTLQYEMLMPEGFNFRKLYAACYKINKNGTSMIDIFKSYYPKSILETLPISLWEGLKMTYPKDYEIIKYLLKKENK